MQPYPELFDISYYRSENRDLAGMNDEQLLNHYRNYGRAEGRAGTFYALREGFVKLIPSDGHLLEIGPFNKPVVQGSRVKYFDVLDRAGLLERGAAHGLTTDNTPEIDFVSPAGDLSVVAGRYDAVVSSHCIEHQPDLIGHLQSVERLLRPGGRYYLFIPDKRYCFDHFLAESTMADVVVAHLEDRRVHTLRSVVADRAFTTHNDSVRRWTGNHGELTDVRSKAASAAQEWMRSAGAYIDVHAWQFTPRSFEELIGNLNRHGYTRLAPALVFDTAWGRFEFCAILEL